MMNVTSRLFSRRRVLQAAGTLAGTVVWRRLAPIAVGETFEQTASQVDRLTQMRQQMGAAPITIDKLSASASLLSGAGGNVILIQGKDGKVLVDGFVKTAWTNLKTTLDKADRTPITVLIDTHWHFDHADNNGHVRAEGGTVVASENTRRRLTEPHDALGMHFDPEPEAALPNKTFKTALQISINGEALSLSLVPPAHTDTDTFVYLAKANVLHMGDVFFNGNYPFIDASTGGRINGMIDGAERALQMTNARTKIVPGHGPLGDRAALTRYRDMLATIRDRVQKLKAAGRSLAEIQAAKPSAEFDATWGQQGMFNGDGFVELVFVTL
jgi:cyclase